MFNGDIFELGGSNFKNCVVSPAKAYSRSIEAFNMDHFEKVVNQGYTLQSKFRTGCLVWAPKKDVPKKYRAYENTEQSSKLT